MIELTEIKTTDPWGVLRQQINEMQAEIMADQPIIGACLNPTVNLYNNLGQLTGAITASNMQKCFLSALIFPENNGCFVADIIGHCEWNGSGGSNIIPVGQYTKFVIDIPTVQKPDGTAYTSFLTPSHLGLPHHAKDPAQQFYIGVSGTNLTGGNYTSPFEGAYIETNANTPSTLNVVVTTRVPITVTSNSIIALNF